MKSPVYTLGSEEFAFFANRVEEVLKEKDIPHIVVGGIATQAHILDRLCKHHKRDIVSLVSDENLRDQDYLRATDAVDVALKFPEYDALKGLEGKELEFAENQAHLTTGKRINSIWDAIANGCDNGDYLSCTGDHIFNYGLQRGGLQRPIFSVSVDRNMRSPIFIKISRRPEDLEALDTKFYNQFVNSGVDLSIPYAGGCNLNFRVLRPEHLLAVKIALDRPKDSMDVRNLVYTMRLVGEFDKRADFPKFAFQLKKCLIPGYEKQLSRFADAVGVDESVFYGKNHTENRSEAVCSRE